MNRGLALTEVAVSTCYEVTTMLKTDAAGTVPDKISLSTELSSPTVVLSRSYIEARTMSTSTVCERLYELSILSLYQGTRVEQ